MRREDDRIEVAPAWEDLVERKIQEAQERGEFDNLHGRGQPLNLETNPYAKDWELGFKLLKDGGFAPPWVEASREMEAALALAEQERQRWAARAGERAAARRAYLDRIENANVLVDRFNVLTPFAWLQRVRLSADAESRRFDHAWPEE